MQVAKVVKELEIPEGVEVDLEGRRVTVKGEKGTLVRDFSHAPISIQLEGDKVKIQASWPRKREAALVGTVKSHIQNMVTGVTKGFTYKLKIVFSHFPISVKAREDTVAIENFTGERSGRIARIMGNAQVRVKGEDVIVQGIDLQDVSQTAANIQRATKVKEKDQRVFLDGIYVYERHEGMEE
ncbi:50S ribosomal protein L6 [Candidatus Bathyarchaeota archaeon]|nr:50S ribosomal protein L6 [Candidatus Bathyarchaeota archaeon]NIU81032.1 50S ribosomal protein L6 [Candidatus Bathyarchaeota archaeon]NIV67690.1 50S ribosomal protein L6 [Candidatus Bathyarchaeota archaeon]NIW16675.1 50S ribosomal protein L6 [Candidatus Bathyarchaeota archaeon]NIW34889.1 50S ribosomal protein L6 [Candidatus Bathyarchaeota archaeon]